MKKEEYLNSFVKIIMKLELAQSKWRRHDLGWKSSLSSFAKNSGIF
jgi:hypothetical protein